MTHDKAGSNGTGPTGNHILSVKIERFKSLSVVELELGAINVFIGANGAGKSNLLEAIGLLGSAASGRIDDQAALRRGVRPGVPSLYRGSFKKEKAYGSITLHATSRAKAHYMSSFSNAKDQPWWIFQHETVDLGGRKIASRSPAGTTVTGKHFELENRASVAAVVRARQDVPREVRDFLSVLDDYAIFAPVTPVLRGIAPDSAPRNPVGLYGGQLPEALATLLSGKKKNAWLEEALAFIDWADDISVTEPSRAFISPSVPTMREVVSFRDRFMAENRATLSGYDASEGALYILFALVLATHPQAPRCFALDNFDQALNPRAARELTKVFVKHALENSRQVLLTTHNALVLDGLPLDDERVRLFSVERDRKGHTLVRRVPVADLRSLKAKHGDDAVSRLWVSGRLGGMPNVPTF